MYSLAKMPFKELENVMNLIVSVCPYVCPPWLAIVSITHQSQRVDNSTDQSNALLLVGIDLTQDH